MSDDEIRDFWYRSLFEQYYAVHPADRLYARWRMSHKTFDLIRQLRPADSGFHVWAPALMPLGADMLLGRPIEFDDEAEGAVLVPEGAR